MSRLDGDDDAGLILATADDLGREASAKGNRAGERDARQALQDAGLSGRLLSSNDDLVYWKHCVSQLRGTFSQVPNERCPFSNLRERRRQACLARGVCQFCREGRVRPDRRPSGQRREKESCWLTEVATGGSLLVIGGDEME